MGKGLKKEFKSITGVSTLRLVLCRAFYCASCVGCTWPATCVFNVVPHGELNAVCPIGAPWGAQVGTTGATHGKMPACSCCGGMPNMCGTTGMPCGTAAPCKDLATEAHDFLLGCLRLRALASFAVNFVGDTLAGEIGVLRPVAFVASKCGTPRPSPVGLTGGLSDPSWQSSALSGALLSSPELLAFCSWLDDEE